LNYAQFNNVNLNGGTFSSINGQFTNDINILSGTSSIISLQDVNVQSLVLQQLSNLYSSSSSGNLQISNINSTSSTLNFNNVTNLSVDSAYLSNTQFNVEKDFSTLNATFNYVHAFTSTNLIAKTPSGQDVSAQSFFVKKCDVPVLTYCQPPKTPSPIISPGGGLSLGAIIGIVVGIGGGLLIVGIILAIYFNYKKKSNRPERKRKTAETTTIRQTEVDKSLSSVDPSGDSGTESGDGDPSGSSGLGSSTISASHSGEKKGGVPTIKLNVNANANI